MKMIAGILICILGFTSTGLSQASGTRLDQILKENQNKQQQIRRMVMMDQAWVYLVEFPNDIKQNWQQRTILAAKGMAPDRRLGRKNRVFKKV